MLPARPCGDFAVERIVPIGLIPTDAPTAVQLRAIHILVAEAHQATAQDCWLLFLGKVTAGAFQAMLPAVSLAGGLPANTLRTVPLLDPLLLAKGDLFAVRLLPQGQPMPLVGLSILPEEGSLASRRTPRV